MLSRFSHVQLFATLWTIACQAPLSMGFFRQEYWSGLPCPSPGDLPTPGMEPTSLSLMSPALAGGFFTTSATWEAPNRTTAKDKKKKKKNIANKRKELKTDSEGFPSGSVVKNLPVSTRDTGSIPVSGKIPHFLEQLKPMHYNY